MPKSKTDIYQVSKEEFEENIKVMSFFAAISSGETKTGKCNAHWYQLYVTPDQVRKLSKVFGIPCRGSKERPMFSFFTASEWRFDDSGELIDYDVFTGLVSTDWTVGVESV